MASPKIHKALKPYPLDDFLEALSSGVLLIEPKSGSIAYANQRVLNWLGLDRTQVEGKALVAFVRLQRKDDCPLCSGQGEGFSELHPAFLTSADDESKGLKVKLRHSQLEGMVLAMIDSFEEDLSLSSAHSDFVSTVSHEFRTPLTSIKGFAETMLRYGDKLPPEHSRRFVIIIKEQADRLTRMVENLLSVSKLGAGRVELAYMPVPLRPMLEKIINSVEMKEKSLRQFVLNLDENETQPAWSDPDKLEQVLLNLVDNAAKYSFEGNTVTITVKPFEGRRDFLELRIKDEGVGIAKEHLHKIFTKFARVDNPLTRNVEGSGLGLYITKSLTLALGGSIDVESEPNKGTTFILRFPMATTERQEAYKRRLLIEPSVQEDS